MVVSKTERVTLSHNAKNEDIDDAGNEGAEDDDTEGTDDADDEDWGC